MRRAIYILSLLLCTALPAVAAKNSRATREPSDGLRFLYRAGERIDRYLMQGIDTNYITLPEHCWQAAFTTGMVGINSNLTAVLSPTIGRVQLLSRTSPSVDLGFRLAYRSLGFGYSWDALHAYSQKLSFSLGSKRFGLDFLHQKSANIRGMIVLPDLANSPAAPFDQGLIRISNTNLSLWYALNAAHYSHRAAISQSYVQRRTAGSLLLSLSYMASDLSIHDSIKIEGKPMIAMLMSDVTHLRTHQVALGLGYGINYTPNRGKVLLHLDAHLKLVCYSIDQITLTVPDSIVLPGEPQYDIQPQFPVHVTGNMRAAVSWEICPWAHMSLCATANNIRFTSKTESSLNKSITMSNWNWQTQLTLGVRLGAGRDRVRHALGEDQLPPPAVVHQTDSTRKRLPQWLTDYFYSPSVHY